MDKLIIEFNKKFDKQKQELIDGFKALGEEKRLPKVLATIEGEQPTYKDYFKAGWQSRQAEVEEKDKRIEELEKTCISYKNQRDDNAQKLMVKSVHYSSIQEELAKLKDRLELAHHIATQSTWSSLKQLRKVVKALRGEHES